MRYLVRGDDYDTKVFISDKPTIQDLLDLAAQYIPHIPPKAISVSIEKQGDKEYIVIFSRN